MNIKEIPYEVRTVDLFTDKNYSSEFKKISPLALVPTLHIDGLTLIESLNILNYLEETRPKIPLLPKDRVKRARVRELSEIIVSGIQPLQNIGTIRKVSDDKSDRLKWINYWITRGFEGVESILSSTSGKYSVGDEITMADLCLIPQVFNARIYEVDISKFKNILRIDSELKHHPAIISSHPHNQVDCPHKK